MSFADGVSRARSQAVPEQIIGSYAIGETVGRGSFGKVKRGRHLHSGEPVAIKILNREKLKSANMDKKIHREIEILQLFSHPNICRLYEVISTATDMYLIMEYVEGGELYDYIVQKGRIREPEARYIFQQIVCALEYCHHFRVVHRDLKPENILLGAGLQVKLIDFGLSNIMKDGEFLTTSCGSPNYAAPEVISGKLYFGPEVDVWSCGVILYALLCGCLPFDEDTIPLLFKKIKKGKYSTPLTMPTGPRDLIEQIIVVDPLVRLTIPQIRDNMWFNVKLPMRLSFNESLFSSPDDRIISVLVSETARKMSLREKDVRRELERGQGPAHVAYNILLDARRRKEIAAEVRELGVVDDNTHGGMNLQPSAPFQPKAMERELNMGLMLSQSPAMEVLLDHSDATANKMAYNSGTFVPASAHDRQTPTQCHTPVTAGAFSMSRRSGSLSNTTTNNASGVSPHASGSMPRTALVMGSQKQRIVPGTLQLGASLSEQPRVGSVARKYAMYTAEEEEFIVNHNYGWRVGLMTDWDSAKTLQCVYSVLRDFNMQWKVLAPFRLLARTTPHTWSVLQSRLPSRAGSAGPSAATSTAPIPILVPPGSRGFEDGGIRSCSPPTRERRSLGSRPTGENYFGGFESATSEQSGSSSREPAAAAASAPAHLPALRLAAQHPAAAAAAASSASVTTTTDTANASPVSLTDNDEVIMCIYIFRVHESHDKGFLLDFSIQKNTLIGMDVVLKLSNEMISRVG